MSYDVYVTVPSVSKSETSSFKLNGSFASDSVTLTVNGCFFPLVVSTVIFAVPTLTPRILPAWLTVAIFVSSLDHLSVLFRAFDGETVTIALTLSPTFIVIASVFFTDKVCTSTYEFTTFTKHFASKPPSSVVAVISVIPTPTGFTLPFSSTRAIFVFLDFHVMFWFVAFFGNISVCKSLPSPPV